MVGAVKRQTAAGVPTKVHKWQRPIGNMTFLHQRFGSKRREGNSFGATFTSSGTSGWLMDTLRGLPRVLRELAGGGSGVRLLDGFVAFPFSSGFTL